jgi:hypothetical protein
MCPIQQDIITVRHNKCPKKFKKSLQHINDMFPIFKKEATDELIKSGIKEEDIDPIIVDSIIKLKLKLYIN